LFEKAEKLSDVPNVKQLKGHPSAYRYRKENSELAFIWRKIQSFLQHSIIGIKYTIDFLDMLDRGGHMGNTYMKKLNS